MNEGEYRVKANHGKSKLFGIKAKVDGEVSMAYMKGDKMIGYSTLAEINHQFSEGPFMEFTTNVESKN